MAPTPSPVRGVYRQPGRTHPFKYIFFWILVTIQKLKDKLGMKKEDEASGYGAKSTNKLEVLDGVHELPKEFPESVDAVYFVGVNQEGFGILCSAARRHNGLVQSAFELIVPGVGVLLHPKLPDTSIKVDPKNEKGQWCVDGLEITPVEVGRRWRLKKSGPMRLLPENFQGVPDVKTDTKMVNVDFEATWDATSRIFDTDTDIHIHSISDSVAREDWSREMFETLKKQHQTHLEQFGEVKAKVTIEGHGTFNPRIQVLRDHTFGKFRDWNEFHRYSIFYLFCEDGSGLNLTNLSRPVTMSRLAFGYRVYPDGSIKPVPRTDFELFKHDEEGHAKPGLTFQAKGGGKLPLLWPEVYDVTIDKVFAAPSFYIGNDRDAKITDCFVRGTINGRPCWGINEWMQGYHGEGSTRSELYQRAEKED